MDIAFQFKNFPYYGLYHFLQHHCIRVVFEQHEIYQSGVDKHFIHHGTIDDNGDFRCRIFNFFRVLASDWDFPYADMRHLDFRRQ